MVVPSETRPVVPSQLFYGVVPSHRICFPLPTKTCLVLLVLFCFVFIIEFFHV